MDREYRFPMKKSLCSAGVLLFSSLFCAPAALGASVAGTVAASQPTALERIDRAFAEGRIDAPTRAIYGLYALKAPERLPADLRPAPGEPRPRCATPIFHRAWLERDAFDAQQAADYAMFAARPSLPDSVPAAVNPVLVHYDSSVEPFVSNPGLADQVAAWADTAWNMEIGGMGFQAPLADDFNGTTADNPDNQIDIYLQTGLNYAYTAGEAEQPSTTYSDATAYAVIDPTLPNLETYVAHEFNHTSQYSYDAHEADLIYEATAVFVEDKVYDSVNDYVSFVADFQNHPERNLSYATYDDSYMYGAGIWLRWLSDQYAGGSASIGPSIWLHSEQDDTTNSKSFFAALNQDVLPGLGLGSVEEMYQQFAGYRWLSGANSDGWDAESANWQTVAPIQSFTLSNGSDGIVTPNAPQPLGVNYVEVDTTGGVSGDKLTFTLHGDPGVSWAVTKIEIPAAGGSATITPSAVDGGDGMVRVSSTTVSDFSKVIFAVTNLGTAGQNPDALDPATSEHTGPVTPTSFKYDVFYSADGKDPGEPVGCSCSVARAPRPGEIAFPLLLALGALGLVVRRRTRVA